MQEKKTLHDSADAEASRSQIDTHFGQVAH